jgi:cytoskeletal protein CcmA (bactofilin family)
MSIFGKTENHLQAGATTLISKLTEVTGDLQFSGNLEIEGSFHGNIVASGSNASLRVLHEGKVIGKIQVPVVIINGHVDGEVHSSKHLELAAKATVQGNLYYQYLEVVKGAQVNGKMVHVAAGGTADSSSSVNT